MLRVLFGLNNIKIARNRHLFYADSKLRRHNLIHMELCPPTLADGQVVMTERQVREFLEEQTLDDPDVEELDLDSDRHHGQAGLLSIKQPQIRLSDVKLPQKIKTDLQAITTQYKNQDIIKSWGIDKKIPYGRALSLLFYGPPGTGKTMTAEALAHEVGQPLGVVDYSQIMNKWVGESEKYIRKVFADAKRMDCVLLFDECDSLLQTRIQSQSAVDRMTNNLVNLLLQEIEAFEGIVILTTNRQEALDPAIERRLALRISFPLPDLDIRAKLWKGFFTNEMPLSSDIDFQLLAKKYPLPGGDIKNVVLRSVRACLTLPSHKQIITSALIEEEAREEMITHLNPASSHIGF